LLLSGYEGMKQREQGTPAYCARCLEESIDRLIDLYEQWSPGNPDPDEDAMPAEMSNVIEHRR
jgi:hypothetical protein